MAAPNYKPKSQSSMPPPLPKKLKAASSRPPPLPGSAERRASSSPPPLIDEGSVTTSGVRLARPSARSEDTQVTGIHPYHEEWGDVFPGRKRATCIINERAFIAIRVRTKDGWPDHGLIERLNRALAPKKVTLVTKSPVDLSGDEVYFSTDVMVRLNHELGIYEIFRHGVAKTELHDAMLQVDLVAASFFNQKDRYKSK